ncbi:hypothetical protein [Rhodopseudomonas boonkerdii]|nr:hypothetical protein [Rhodopseudomonas boonkerdii]
MQRGVSEEGLAEEREWEAKQRKMMEEHARRIYGARGDIEPK